MTLTLDPETHIYSDGTDRKWTSVSKVISTVMAKSWEGVDPAVIANAADRGQRVENYATEILKTGGCVTAPNEREDVLERVECFYRWYEASAISLVAAQLKVSDEPNGIAGTLDFILSGTAGDAIVDLKCTAQPEASWALQLGAYSSMYPAPHDVVGVLHVNPKYAKGWIWREYDPFIVRSQWASALNWYRTLESLKAK